MSTSILFVFVNGYLVYLAFSAGKAETRLEIQTIFQFKLWRVE